MDVLGKVCTVLPSGQGLDAGIQTCNSTGDRSVVPRLHRMPYILYGLVEPSSSRGSFWTGVLILMPWSSLSTRPQSNTDIILVVHREGSHYWESSSSGASHQTQIGSGITSTPNQEHPQRFRKVPIASRVSRSIQHSLPTRIKVLDYTCDQERLRSRLFAMVYKPTTHY